MSSEGPKLKKRKTLTYNQRIKVQIAEKQAAEERRRKMEFEKHAEA